MVITIAKTNITLMLVSGDWTTRTVDGGGGSHVPH